MNAVSRIRMHEIEKDFHLVFTGLNFGQFEINKLKFYNQIKNFI